MSGNIELALLTRVIADQDFHSVEKSRIDGSFFTHEVARDVFEYLKFIYHHPQTHGMVPSFDLIKMHFPAFHPVNAPDAVPVLASELRRQKVRTELLLLAQNIQLKADTDPLSAMADLRAGSAAISTLSEVGEDLSMSSAYEMLLSNYNTVSLSGGVIGIPYPWDALNEETQGMQGGQFIILFGRPKSMKSWIGINIGVTAYLKSRKRVLFYTREMSPMMVAQRVAAALGRVDYKAFKNGTLQPHLKQKAFTILQELMDDEKSMGTHGLHQPFFIITSDRSASNGGGGGGVSWLQSKIRDLKPDLVIVDGMYLMKDDRTNQRTVDWKAITHISQDLKLTAQEYNIPVIGITQANRAAQSKKGEDLTELAFSDAFGQDADAVFRVSKKDIVDEATKQRKTELLLTAPGLREGRFDGIVIKGEPATDFGYIRTIVSLDELDEAEEEYGKKSGNGAPKQQGFKPKPTFMTPKVAMKGA